MKMQNTCKNREGRVWKNLLKIPEKVVVNKKMMKIQMKRMGMTVYKKGKITQITKII